MPVQLAQKIWFQQTSTSRRSKFQANGIKQNLLDSQRKLYKSIQLAHQLPYLQGFSQKELKINSIQLQSYVGILLKLHPKSKFSIGLPQVRLFCTRKQIQQLIVSLNLQINRQVEKYQEKSLLTTQQQLSIQTGFNKYFSFEYKKQSGDKQQRFMFNNFQSEYRVEQMKDNHCFPPHFLHAQPLGVSQLHFLQFQFASLLSHFLQAQPFGLYQSQFLHFQLAYLLSHFLQAYPLGASQLQLLQCQLASLLPHLLHQYPLGASLSQFLQRQLASLFPHLQAQPLGLLKSQLQHLQQAYLLPHLQAYPFGTYHQQASFIPPPHLFMVLPVGLQIWQVVQAQLASLFLHLGHQQPFLTPCLQFLQFHSILMLQQNILPHLCKLFNNPKIHHICTHYLIKLNNSIILYDFINTFLFLKVLAFISFNYLCYFLTFLLLYGQVVKKKTYIYLFQIKITSLSSKMYQLQSLNAAFMRPVYSPRSEMSRYTSDVQKNKTSLAINIDKETLALFKNEYENYDNKIDKINFISIGLKILKSWQKDMQYRQSRLIVYLMSLFQEIQNKVDGIYVTWEEFNNLIIEKALNLKSLQSHDSEAVSQLKHVVWSKGKYKPLTPVKKIVFINHQKKIAILCEESNKIEFLSMVPTQQYLNFKPLVLERQDLTVEKTLVKRVKNQGSRAVVKQNYKKKVVVSGYSVTFIDMIYVSSERYEMLLTSSTDCIIRGWDLHGTTPTLAKQPENQQQKMTHQFSVQIHCMAWDQINDVLYCSANDSKIYLWMVKTDTEKQISDPEGHRAMISSMIMIPKLQFLATGDYDGKLILWDTISLTKKYKYQQHTRSIVSMTFHEALILLFTAAFDHSICVWNPYIPSLIYKISCNSNVLQVQIIPGTNYLAALDQDSNLRIRQISKFNLISTYVVDRPDENDLNDPQDREGFNKIQPTCMAVSDDPIRFYFGGHSIKCRQFDENQALVSSQHYPIILKYHSQKMKLYVIIKNSILIWDILTGQLYDILQSQADQQITSIDIIQNSGRFIVGDSQGSIYLRKLENGIKISRIYKHRQKVSVNHLLSRRGGIWNESVVIGCCSDGEIVVLGKDQSNDIALLRNFNIRKHFPNVNILSMQYEQKRNLLILGTNTGDIICMDVDKNRITNHISAQSLEAIKFYIKFDIPSLVTFGKNGEILGVYLPPHSKKFKPACNLYVSSSKLQQKIISIAMCKLSKACFMGFENGTVAQILLNDSLLNNQQTTNKQVRKVQSQWEVKFTDTPKDMILIIDETVLAVILYMKNITLMSAKNGEVLNVLPSYAYTSKSNFYENPLFYYSNSAIHQRTRQGKVDKAQEKEKLNYLNNAQKGINHQIYVPQLKKYHNIEFSNQIQDKKQLRIFHDPFFLASQYKKLTNPSKKEQKNQDSSANFVDENELNRVVWNKEWKIFANFKDLVDKKLEEIVKTKQECLILIDKPVKRMTRNNSVSNAKNVQRAVEVRQNWEKVKQQLQDDNYKTKSKLLSLSSFKIPNGSSFYSKKIGQTENKLKEEANEKQKHKSLYKNESSPYIRLGLALQKINEHDEKAVKFIELGQKTKLDLGKSLKLPKINTRQQRY